MSGVKKLYGARLAAGVLSADPAQAAAVERLDTLAKQLGKSGGWFGGAKPKGVYLWGAVGRGKSMLMDLFFEAAPVKARRRVHFHDFMLETHAFIFEWRKLPQQERRRHAAHVSNAGDDPIAPAAKHVADQAELLCFDEFHVNQIADAMILGRLFEQLFDRGVMIVATSNRKPSELYKDGINRQLFVPFIKRLEDELDVIELAATRDYRLERLSVAPVYYAPLGPDADKAMDAAFARLTAGASPVPDALDVQGRKVAVPRQAMGVARFTFEELCTKPLGAADYLAIARHYRTVLVDGVPKMGRDQRTWAARFVTLIDALYESKTKLVMSAGAQPDDLYPAGDGAFEFQRTASRLHEMRSNDYLASEREHAAEGAGEMTTSPVADDPVMQRIFEALHLYNAGRRAEAREAFAAIWSDIEDGDAFHQCTLAHYMADAQDDPKDELEWDRRALAAADRIVKERPDAAGLTVLSFYPSLHLNLADVMHRTGDVDGARKHLQLARQASDALGEDRYGEMIRGGIERLTGRLSVTGSPG